jgi:hypothetical protein
MKTLMQTVAAVAALAILGGCALLDDSDEPAQQTQVRYDYAPLRFRVKLGYTVNFTYTPRDQSDAADYVIAEFERRLESDGNGGNGYQIAEGQQPDLYVAITVNSDPSNNKSMHVDIRGASTNVPGGTSAAGTTYPYLFGLNTGATYRDPDTMIDDMADQVNGYIANGWWNTVTQ